jgi:hypothetical protein
MVNPIINTAAIEPLFASHEEPNFHRVRAEKSGESAKVVKGRRPSPITVANNLRSFVKGWRESDYAGASDTTCELLFHWFEQDHVVETRAGERIPFRYYFCQREAIESLIYLWEVRGIRNLSNIISEFGGEDRETAALGVNPDDDRWARYAFKVATGAGKTKELRKRITEHNRVMVLNDEAHHLWDPGSAWNEAIAFLHSEIYEKTGGGLAAQLDFSATPKDNHGRIFQHVVCDSPLGEAVDAGIVRRPLSAQG